MFKAQYLLTLVTILTVPRYIECYGRGSTLGTAGIFPGTYWCGDGNIANEKSSLGIFPGSDRCCRAHDLCPFKIRKFSQAFGIVNTRPHTALHCSCDESFRTCLQMDGSQNSKLIGRFYFNQLRAPCFTLQEGKSCIERTWWGRCSKFNSTGVVGSWREARQFDTIQYDGK